MSKMRHSSWMIDGRKVPEILFILIYRHTTFGICMMHDCHTGMFLTYRYWYLQCMMMIVMHTIYAFNYSVCNRQEEWWKGLYIVPMGISKHIIHYILTTRPHLYCPLNKLQQLWLRHQSGFEHNDAVHVWVLWVAAITAVSSSQLISV